MKFLIFFSGVVLGAAITSFLLMGNYDLLSSGKGDVVSLKKDVYLIEDKQVRVTLPKGTRLKLKSQYDDVGEFSLDIVITDLSVIEKSSGSAMYFSDQDIKRSDQLEK